MPLTTLKVKNAKPGRHVDGRGLHLVVKPSGAKQWVLRMQRNGWRRDYGLGSALDVSLAEAREAAVTLLRRVREGCDPIAERRQARRMAPNFETAARACHAALGEGWISGHYARWLSGFELHIFPRIGKKPVDQVDSACVVYALSAIWLKIPESARRLLQRIGVVLDFAHIKGWLPAEVSLHSVRKGLPRQNDKKGHMEAMPYAEVPAFIQKLAKAEPTIGRKALRFTIYNAVRSNETRFAVWTEFDLDKAVWTNVYDECRGAMLVHKIQHSSEDGQIYDILIYLIPHRGSSLASVASVEYFFGKYWGEKIFPSEDRSRGFPVVTSAYGPFLCTAKLHFNDGTTALVSRYVDFEMGGTSPVV